MLEALHHPFFQRALAAGLLASIACGVVGSYVVVKRMASISGGLAHAAFGGVGFGYLVGMPPLWGATLFALVCGGILGWTHRRIRESLDTLIAVMWAVGMALGVVFVSLAPGYAPDLMTYLFGSILLVPPVFLWVMVLLDGVILATVALLFKEFRAVSLDEEYCRILGLPTEGIFLGLLVLVALAIVVLIQVVGVILAIALLTLPAAVGRQWSDGLGRMMVLATLFGMGCTTVGLFLSYWFSASRGLDLPTGPLIILLAAAGFGLSGILRRATVRRPGAGAAGR